MSGFALHRDAFADLDEIWEFIAADNLAAADRVIGEVFGSSPLFTAVGTRE